MDISSEILNTSILRGGGVTEKNLGNYLYKYILDINNAIPCFFLYFKGEVGIDSKFQA